jgi:hypothetical protein
MGVSKPLLCCVGAVKLKTRTRWLPCELYQIFKEKCESSGN